MVRAMSNELCFFVPSPRRDSRGHPLAMDGLNEIIARERGNLHAAAKAKHEATAYVSYIAARAAHEQHWHTPEGRCHVTLTFVEINHRRDPDNVFAGAKCVLDGLTARADLGAGVIMDDSQACITLVCALADTTDKERPGVWVRIREE